MMKKILNSPDLSSFTLEIVVKTILFLMGVWGCLAIYNAMSANGGPVYFAGRQLLWLIIGIIVLLAGAKIPFKYYLFSVVPIAVAFYAVLWAVLFFGIKINGMRGWFSCGNLYFQPSEFAKPFFLLLLTVTALKIRRPLPAFLTGIGITALWTAPLIMQPDFGTAAIYIAGFIIIFWLCGTPARYFFWLLPSFIPAGLLAIYKNPYLFNRLAGFFNPESDPLGSGWHIRQFQFTLARGGLSGTSWGKALWSNSYLPLPHSDSAFASLAESLGFSGACPVILTVMALVVCFYFMALRAGSRPRRVFMIGGVTVFAVQSLLHISVNLALLPPTGITLPLISYGGSSLLSTMLLFGMMLSAARHPDEITSDRPPSPPERKNGHSRHAAAD